MGGCFQKLRACCCCCGDSCKYQKSSTPSKVRFRGSKNKIQDVGGVDERFAIPEGTHNVKLPGEKFCTINSATFLPTGDIIFADSINKKLKLYSCNFQYISCLEFPSPAQNVCSSPNLPLLYATFPDRVRQIHVDGVMMKRSGFIKTPGHCRGICINKFDGKAISLNVAEDVGQVNLMTPGGNVQLEINEDKEGNKIFVRPDHLAVNRNLTIIVADKGSNSVIGIRNNGKILFRYKGLRHPQAIVCDELNYIYVGGLNSVHQLTEEGKLVKIFLTKAEIGFSPLCLTYNASKKLLLATGKGARIAMFKLT